MSKSDQSPETPYKYWAFISYSHQDNLAVRGDGSGDHIQWANWLHEQLETFRVPDGYRDRPAATGEPMPERFFPAFRDEAELPTSHDLGGQIRDALRRSRFLIVIATPRSAHSRYVNEEVRHFRQLGRGDRILTLIVDGEPNVRLHPKSGWTAGDDCFCPALVHPLRPDGEVDTTRLLPEEPIAADVRVKGTEPPREMRLSEHTDSDRQDLLDFMKLKLIAGLMGVGLDELVQRDARRKAEESRLKSKRLRIIATTVSVLATLAIAGGILALLQRNQAQLQRNNAIRAQEETTNVFSLSHYLRAAELIPSHQNAKALAYLASSIRINPRNTAAASRMLFFLQQQHLYAPTEEIASKSLDILDVCYVSDEKYIFLAKRETSIVYINDVADLQSFASKLKTVSREVDQYVADQLSIDAKKSLLNYQAGEDDPAQLLTPLVSDLNRLILGPLVYETHRFEGVNLCSETKQLLLQNPQGEDLRRLNRMLLGDAYPQELARHYEIAAFDGKTRQKQFEFLPMEGNDARFTNNGKTFYTFLMDYESPGPLGISTHTIAYYNTSNGRPLRKLMSHTYTPSKKNNPQETPAEEFLITYDNQEKRLAIAYADGTQENTIAIYETKSGKCLKIFPGTDLQCLKFSPDSSILAVCSGTIFDVEVCYGQLDLYNVSPESPPEEWRCIGSLKFDNPTLQSAFSSDGKNVAIACSDNSLHLVNVDPPAISATYTADDHGLGYSPSGNELLAGRWIWDRVGHDLPLVQLTDKSKINTKNIEKLSSNDNTSKRGHDVTETSGENFILTLSDTQSGNDVEVFNKMARSILENQRAVFRGPHMWYRKDGELFVSISDRNARIWEATTGKPLTDNIVLPRLCGGGGPCFSPNNEYVAFAGAAQEIYYDGAWAIVHDARTGTPLCDEISWPELDFTGHPRVSDDGRHLYLFSDRGPVYGIDIPYGTTTVPSWLADLAEVVGGYCISDGAIMKEIELGKRASVLHSIRMALAQSTAHDEWTKFGRWLLEDNSSISVSPYSSKSSKEYFHLAAEQAQGTALKIPIRNTSSIDLTTAEIEAISHLSSSMAEDQGISNDINTICTTSSDVWIGTSESGLHRLDRRTLAWVSYEKSDISDRICEVYADGSRVVVVHMLANAETVKDFTENRGKSGHRY